MKRSFLQIFSMIIIIQIGILSQPTDLFFTEYIEGTSFNKALEIYNGSGSNIDLSSGNYIVEIYSNGSGTVSTTITLTGTINGNDVFVLAHSSADAAILAAADQTTGSVNFNGDDAIVLKKGGAGGTILDVIGQVGVDPGTEWGSGLTSTVDNTLRRKAGTTVGDTNKDDAFEPSSEWDGYATDTFDGLGSPLPVPVELSSFTASLKGNEVNLKWTTKTEVNNYGFDVERKKREVKSDIWESIGFVPGAGNSNSPRNYSYADQNISGYGKISYRLKQLDSDGKYEYSKEVEVDFGSVKNFALFQNYPNPFNPYTLISYSIPQTVHVKLSIFNVLGSEIAILVDEFKEAGHYSKEFSIAQNGLNLTNGVYFYKLEAGTFAATKKFILMK